MNGVHNIFRGTPRAKLLLSVSHSKIGL